MAYVMLSRWLLSRSHTGTSSTPPRGAEDCVSASPVHRAAGAAELCRAHGELLVSALFASMVESFTTALADDFYADVFQFQSLAGRRRRRLPIRRPAEVKQTVLRRGAVLGRAGR